MPARKLQKADRERLRRDHLNEQFAKLAGVLGEIYLRYAFSLFVFQQVQICRNTINLAWRS